jgi:hypothetical protein
MASEESSQALGHAAGILDLQQVGRPGKDERLDVGQPREKPAPRHRPGIPCAEASRRS